MRDLTVLGFVLIAFAVSLAGQEPSADPYRLNAVESALKLRSGGQRIVIGHLQKVIYRLGDAVSVAILKITKKEDLGNPQTVRDLLPLIQEAFDHPELIVVESDRRPAVTLVLLSYLEQNTMDAQTLREIQQLTERLLRSTS